MRDSYTIDSVKSEFKESDKNVAASNESSIIMLWDRNRYYTGFWPIIHNRCRSTSSVSNTGKKDWTKSIETEWMYHMVISLRL